MFCIQGFSKNKMGEIYQSVLVRGMYSNYIRVNALIDSGANANVNVVSYKFARKFYSVGDINKSKKVKVFFTDKKKGIYPIIFLQIKVRGEYRNFPFIVIKEGFGKNMLLGVRFLQDTDKTIYFKDDRIHFRKLSKRKKLWL